MNPWSTDIFTGSTSLSDPELTKTFRNIFSQAPTDEKIWDGVHYDADYTLYSFPLTQTGELKIYPRHSVVRSLESLNYSTSEQIPSKRKEIYFVTLTCPATEFSAALQTMTDRGLEDLKHISLGLPSSRAQHIRVYQPQANTILILTNKTPTPLLMRKVFAVVPILFPTEFEKTGLPAELFYNVLAAKETWEESFKTWLHEHDILGAMKLKDLLKTIEAITVEEKRGLQERYDQLQQEISRTQNLLRTSFRERRETGARLLLVNQEQSKGLEDFLEFVQKNNTIKDMFFDSENQGLVFVISAPVGSDNEILEIMLNNNSDFCSKHLMKVLEVVFLEGKYTMFFKSAIGFDLTRKTVQRIHQGGRADVESIFGIENPHLKHFNCWGSNLDYIEEALHDRNYLQAIAIAQDAVGCLAWDDSVVVERFVTDMEEWYDSETDDYKVFDKPCLIDNDTQEQLSIKELIERLFPE